MSMTEQQKILQRLRELHKYLHLLGEHIIQIYNSLETIETNIKEMNDNHIALIEVNETDLNSVKGMMVTMSEVNNLLREINEGIAGSFPSLLTLERPREEESVEEETVEGETVQETIKKRRFSFLSRF